MYVVLFACQSVSENLHTTAVLLIEIRPVLIQPEYRPGGIIKFVDIYLEIREGCIEWQLYNRSKRGKFESHIGRMPRVLFVLVSRGSVRFGFKANEGDLIFGDATGSDDEVERKS